MSAEVKVPASQMVFMGYRCHEALGLLELALHENSGSLLTISFGHATAPVFAHSLLQLATKKDREARRKLKRQACKHSVGQARGRPNC